MQAMKLLVIDRDDVEALLDVRTATSIVDAAMRALSRGETRHLVRRIMPLPGSDGGLGDMPGSLGPGKPFGLKCIAGFPSPRPGQASHRGMVLLFAAESGEPVAVIEAGSLTAIRTAAATASATRYLARTDARSLGLFGTGEQARWHVPALLAARPFETITVWSRDPARAAHFARTVRQTYEVNCSAAQNAAQAAAADVLCTLTSASTPILEGEWLQPGAHVNLVGSSSASPRETDDSCVARARYFVDWEESARAQASEFLHALRSGVISEEHLLGEIGAVANGTIAGRRSHDDITLYKSLGVIVQDLACGWHVYESAKAAKRGTLVDF
jgi:ornithine cyclodeaminase/alanine dehydrogenase-like protein (mu-crystallin family)